MSKESNRRKFFYNILKWIQQRLSWVGEKVLILTFYLLVGVFILSWKLGKWVSIKARTSFTSLVGFIYMAYKEWRMRRRIRKEFKEYGIRKSVIEPAWEDMNVAYNLKKKEL